mgnify:CR=1 FL=1
MAVQSNSRRYSANNLSLFSNKDCLINISKPESTLPRKLLLPVMIISRELIRRDVSSDKPAPCSCCEKIEIIGLYFDFTDLSGITDRRRMNM